MDCSGGAVSIDTVTISGPIEEALTLIGLVAGDAGQRSLPPHVYAGLSCIRKFSLKRLFGVHRFAMHGVTRGDRRLQEFETIKNTVRAGFHRTRRLAMVRYEIAL